MKVETIGFKEYLKEVADHEGIVCLGCGGGIQEWVNGVTQTLIDEKIVDSPEPWKMIHQLTTSGGRIDLSFIMAHSANFNMSKMAIWRLKFGNCSWVSDYIVNYASHHNT